MRLSQYHLPALKENPSDAEIISHKYSLRVGLVKQVASGIYTWLPLGLKVLDKIKSIIKEEMNKSGALEVLMPCIQPASFWQESGRYDSYGDEMLHIKDRNERSMLFGPTHEEAVTDAIRGVIKSYKNLPLLLYQMQWKFRDEVRPRFGVMRSREFLMKDAYSFDKNQEDAEKSYDLMYKTYIKIFRRMGLTPIAVKAETGPIGGNLSHEFHILSETGEDTIYYDSRFSQLLESEDMQELRNIYAVSEGMYDPTKCPISFENLSKSKGIEVGHIFYFGDKYSSPMNAKISLESGQNVPIHMGSYGIGISRLVGAIIEAYHDDNGIKWPEAVAPFKIGLINLQIKDNSCTEAANYIYNNLPIDEVLYDETEDSAGVKFTRMDLIGLPWQIIIGKKFINDGLIEVKKRAGEVKFMSVDAVIEHFSSM
ncbi:MAG: proline--tRNA ligase [Candidatus Mesenet longicola]|uniref:Proline--tRNA ligase n=1 Tax=Candidatus Mesenet longicola TaxID=1892558 RepID=A0A8J3HWP7_9RICK|nr:MAG: proline--tRNA ligase [Candidatus Mesenet longicola]GHM59666.1 MAG: proline--tRNA ligase [Candidatus Mesenet longicola]